MFVAAITVLVGTAFLAYGADQACPPSSEVFPCFCDDSNLPPTMSCSENKSLDKLRRVLDKTKGHNISFTFSSSRLGDIPSDFFADHTIEHLSFEKCKITSFGDKPFSGLENSLKKLYVQKSVDGIYGKFTGVQFGHLKRLASVHFDENHFGKVENDWFEGGPESLRELNLENNDVEEIGDRAFESLSNLEQLWIGDNLIKAVSRSMFPKSAEKLAFLDMSFNRISELPDDLFESMTALRRVNAAGNKLRTIPEAVWGGIWPNLEQLYFERNIGFFCDSRIKWIYQQKLPDVLTGRCGPVAADTSLQGKLLKNLKIEDFE